MTFRLYFLDMKTSLFDYKLPKTRIAQRSVSPRDASRLMVLDRKTGRISERVFHEIGEFLNPGDLLVVNDTKVFRARLLGRLGTGAAAELLLLRPVRNDAKSSVWEALGKPGKKLRLGTIVSGEGWSVEVVRKGKEGIVEVKFPLGTKAVFGLLSKIGHIPVPPYVADEPVRESDYQTVYAREVGSIAAPTAGFHFTKRLVASLKRKGVKFASVTLHVGIGTFRPMTADDTDEHKMHSEYAEIPATTLKAIRETKRRGGRVIVVGTTAMRALEGLAEASCQLPVASGSAAASTGHWLLATGRRAGWLDIFITPGYRFKVADALVTNFHLPKSTLLVLVSAFAGRENVMRAYRRAVRERYRFYSFGDAMLVV